MSSLEEKIDEIITDAARENRLTFHDLMDDEKRTLVAWLLAGSEQGLADIENFAQVQSAVASVIITRGSRESIDYLLHEIDVAFMTGDGIEPHYAEEIQRMLSDKWDDENRKPNEHFEHDAMQRTRSLRTERRMGHPY